MARTTAGTAAMVALLATGAAAPVHAAPGPEMALVIHLTDSAHVPSGYLAEAEQQVTRVFREAGVRIVWTGGAAATAQPDGAFHADVLLLSKEMAARKIQLDGLDGQTLGRASRESRRASIFCDRIVDHARLTLANGARLLGAVIAHEIGHILLPEYSHSTFGIMRAGWEGRMGRVPGFTNDQRRMIREGLAAVSRN